MPSAPLCRSCSAQRSFVQIMDESKNMCPIHTCKDTKEGITDIKYSPNNRLMAVYTHDTVIDIYR